MTDKTADHLRYREDFMDWFSMTSPQTLDFSLPSTIREFAYQAWKDATIKSNTRADSGEAVADKLSSLISEYWQLAYAEGKSGRTEDTPEGDAQRCWSGIQECLRDITHPRATSDEVERDAALRTCKALLDSMVEFDGVVDGELFNLAYEAIDAALAKRGEVG